MRFMDFIFMLTRRDETVANCLAVLDEVLPLGLRHIGFKDVGVAPQVLKEMTRRIKAAGAVSYLEVVSESPEASLRSAHMAVELGVDRLLGGTDAGAVLKVIDGSAIAYYPFPGEPHGHPTRLAGDAARVGADCRGFVAAGAAGADLLAYRATEAEPMDLISAARKSLPAGGLLVAGSIDSCERIAGLKEAGVDGFTIGSAIFNEVIAPERPGIAAQIETVLSCLEAA